MNKKAIRADTIFALLAIFSLFFITVVSQTPPKKLYIPYANLLFILYSFVAVPLFHLSASAFLTTVIANLFRIHVSKTASVILKYTAGLAVLAFLGFVVTQILNARAPIVEFLSGYVPYFILTGLVFALGLRKKPAIPGNETLDK